MIEYCFGLLGLVVLHRVAAAKSLLAMAGACPCFTTNHS